MFENLNRNKAPIRDFLQYKNNLESFPWLLEKEQWTEKFQVCPHNEGHCESGMAQYRQSGPFTIKLPLCETIGPLPESNIDKPTLPSLT